MLLKKLFPPLSDEIVIEADNRWFAINLRELWQYRDLFFMFVRKEFVTKYRQTVLGPLWYIIQPLLLTFTFSFVFGKFGKLATDEVPHELFYLSGIILWNYFVQCFDSTAYALSNNQGIFSKVYFPRLIPPLAAIASKLMSFAVQFALIIVFYLYLALTSDSLAVHPHVTIVLLPFILLITGLTALGAGLWIAAFSVKYRDLGHFIPFMIQLWFYATPIIYPASKVPERYSYVIYLNPIAPAIEALRNGFFGSGVLRWDYLLCSTILSLLLVFSGLAFFSRVERNFIDII